MIKAVIFDYGGVMRFTPNSTIKQIAEAYGVSLQEFLDKSKQFSDLFSCGEISEEEFWEKSSRALNRAIPVEKEDFWIKKYEAEPMYPEMVDFVKQLKAGRLKTIVLSNVTKPYAIITKNKGGYEHFDKVILSCFVGLRKPNPEIYSLAIKKLRIEPEKCLFIDDYKPNLESAEKLGMKTVLAKKPKQVIKDVLEIIKTENK